MECNDLNRRVRYALMLDDADVARMLALADYQASDSDITSWRMKEGEESYQACPPAALRAMLNGLIVQRRGKRDTQDGSPPVKSRESAADNCAVDNNEVLKQLRIALYLKSDDVHALITLGGGKITKGEVGALFRKSSARNYRRCGDQVLRWFLAGLARQRNADSPATQ